MAIRLRRRLHTVGPGAVVDGVEVVGEDLVFGPLALELPGEHRLADLAREALLVAHVRVLDVLLSDRARPLDDVAGLQIGHGCPRDAFEVDAVMLVEATVLDGHRRIFHRLWDLAAVHQDAVGGAVQLGDERPVTAVDERGLRARGAAELVEIGQVLREGDEGADEAGDEDDHEQDDDGDDEADPVDPSPVGAAAVAAASPAVLRVGRSLVVSFQLLVLIVRFADCTVCVVRVCRRAASRRRLEAAGRRRGSCGVRAGQAACGPDLSCEAPAHAGASPSPPPSGGPSPKSGSSLSPLLLGLDEVGHHERDLVEHEQRYEHGEHAEGVLAGRGHGGDDGVDEDRVLAVLAQELGRHDADARGEDDDDRQLEHGAEGEQEQGHEREVLLAPVLHVEVGPLNPSSQAGPWEARSGSRTRRRRGRAPNTTTTMG